MTRRIPTYRLPSVGLTKEQHDELVERRNGRPLTMTDPIHVREVDNDRHQPDGMTLLDRYVADAVREKKENDE